jgi:hypothetical protein
MAAAVAAAVVVVVIVFVLNFFVVHINLIKLIELLQFTTLALA